MMKRRLTVAEIVEAYLTLKAIDASLAAYDLTSFQVALLSSLDESSGAPHVTSARKLGITPAGVSTGVDRLELRGLVTRETRHDRDGPGDRRVVDARLTDAGRALLHACADLEITVATSDDDPDPRGA